MAQARCLVTGGAGFLGVNLCRYLLARGYAVTSIDIAPFSYPERNRVEAIVGDIRDAPKLDEATKGADIIVHCAAALPLSSAAEIYSTNVEGTRRVLESAQRHGISRVINISSTAVYGIPDHVPLREHDRLKGIGPYGDSKIKGERICAEYRERGLSVTTLRPKSFVGPERLGVFELLYSWAYEGRNFPVLGRGDNHYQLLDVEDLCEAIFLCATADPKKTSGTFNVAAKNFGTMRENFQAVLDRAGHGGRVVSLPERPSIWLLAILGALHLSPLYPWIYETAAHESTVSTERIEQTLGFTPRHSNREALIRNYDWYVVHRREIRQGTSHRAAWKKGVLEVAKWFF